MDKEELKERTKRFALSIIKTIENLPKTKTGDIVGRQILRSAMSVGANYRSACRAQSYIHFISKMSIVLEESDESLYWLEIAVESGLMNNSITLDLIKEAGELTAIFAASVKTARKNKNLNRKS